MEEQNHDEGRRNKEWTEEEDKVLQTMVNYEKFNVWKLCSRLTNKTEQECKKRHKILTGTQQKRKPFTEKEDFQIIELHKLLGPSWAKIANILKTRTRKQIRERFLNILDENKSRKPFTEKEDLKIYELYMKHGSNWALIAKSFPKRTTDKIRVRYHSHIKKKLEFFDNLTRQNKTY